MSKKEACCVDPADVRVIYYDGPWAPLPAPMYVVPAGKVFVVTAWTLFLWNVADVFLYRDGAPVAFTRGGHLVFPDGIVFTAGQTIGGNIGVGGFHMIYGHEIDA
jgi:hypothetical protein